MLKNGIPKLHAGNLTLPSENCIFNEVRRCFGSREMEHARTREKKEKETVAGWMRKGRRGNPFAFESVAERTWWKLASITCSRPTPGLQAARPRKIHANPGESNRYPVGNNGQEWTTGQFPRLCLRFFTLHASPSSNDNLGSARGRKCQRTVGQKGNDGARENDAKTVNVWLSLTFSPVSLPRLFGTRLSSFLENEYSKSLNENSITRGGFSEQFNRIREMLRSTDC